MSNFEEILDQQVTEVKVPPPLPAGMYLCLVDGQPRHQTVGANQTPVVDFNLRILSATDSVSLTDYPGDVRGKSIRARYFITADAAFILDRFLFEHLGIELGKSRKQAIAEAPGKQVYATIKHTPRDDGQGFYANVAGTAKV